MTAPAPVYADVVPIATPGELMLGVSERQALRAHACMKALAEVRAPGRFLHEFRRMRMNNKRLRLEKQQMLDVLEWIIQRAPTLDPVTLEIRARMGLQDIRPENVDNVLR